MIRKQKRIFSMPIVASVLVLSLFACASVIAQEKAPERGFRPAGSYAFGDMETISTTSGNLMLRVPLAALPPGRGGLSASLSLIYNSKLYDSFPSSAYINHSYYDVTNIKQSQMGGWRYGYKYELYSEGRYAGVDENGEIDACTAFNGYVAKLSLITPDGGKHDLVLTGGTDGSGYQSVWQDGRAACAGWTGSTGTLVYYTTDGTFLRLEVEHDSDTNLLNNPWTLYLPDGGRVTGGGSSQKIYDRNNNYIEIVDGTYNSHSATFLNDQVGRSIIIERESATNQDTIHAVGFNNAALTTTVVWTTVQVHKAYYREVGTPFNLPASWKSVSQINLPSQAGSLSYSFGYNADGSNPTVGWGELNSVTLPSGAKTTYTYLQDNQNNINWYLVPQNRPTQKQLVYRPEYDGASISNTPCNPGTETCITETTSYGMTYYDTETAISSTIIAPDGGVTTEYFNKNEDGTINQAGLVYKSVAPDGTVTERYWRDNIPYSSPVGTETHYAKYEFTSIPNASGTLTQTAIREYSYDKNGNVTRAAAYDWVSYGDVPRNGQGRPYAPPTGAQPKTVTVNTFYNPTPDASDSTTYDSDSFHLAGSPRLHRTLESSEVQNSSGTALSRAEMFYDYTSTTGVVTYPIGNLTQQKSWDSTKGSISRPLGSGNSIYTSAQYDSYGNPTLTTDANNVQTQRVYGSVGGYTGLYPTEARVAYGTSVQRYTTMVYDFSSGVVTSATDQDNSVTTITDYDDLARPKLVKNAYNATEETRTVTDYSDTYRRVIVRSDLDTAGDSKLVSIRHYDQLGRIRLSRQLENSATESETDETKGIKVQTRYLTNGSNTYALTSNPYRANYSYNAGSEATMGWTRSKSDVVGRVLEVQSFSGASLPSPWGSNTSTTGTVTTAYDAQFTTVTDQASKVRRSMMNGLGQLARVDEPDGSGSLGTTASPNQATSYTYDQLSNLTQVSQGSQTRTFVYSSLGRLSSANNPESGTVSYAYDNNGNLTSKVDARSVTTNYVYDALNRVTSRSYSDSTPTVTYTYDASGVAYSKGRLTSVSSSVSITNYTAYDPLGRVTSGNQVTDSQTYSMSYGYNRAGGRTSLTYPSGRVITSEYDTAGRLAGVRDQSSGVYYAGAASSDSNRMQYSPQGAVSVMKLGNGLWEHTNFNSRLQPTEMGLGTSSTGSSVMGLTYSYGSTNNNGNVQSIIYSGGGLSYTQSFGYDSLNRLTTSSESGSSWSQTNGYDRYGNRWVDLGGGNQSLSFNTSNNRITNSGYGYDSAGNLTADGVHTYGFDAENKIKTVDSVNDVYRYDGDGNRVRKNFTYGEQVRMVYSGGQLVAEYDLSNGSLKKEYVYGAKGLIATIEPSTGIRYTTADHLGSPRVVTNASAGVVSRHDYKPFGEEIGLIGGRTTGMGFSVGDGLRQKFTQKERDNETGLDYFLARYYSSTQGRFMTADSVAGTLTNPQSLNLYAYVLNSPLAYTDPTGHMVNPGSYNPARCLFGEGLGCNSEPMAGQDPTRPPTTINPATVPEGWEIRPNGSLARKGGETIVAEMEIRATRRGIFRRIISRVARWLPFARFAGGPVTEFATEAAIQMAFPNPVGGGDADLGDSSTPWLTPDVQATFQNEVFYRHRLEQETTFFRYFGPNAMIGPGVGYFSAQQFPTAELARQMLALSPMVTSNRAEQVVSVTVPAGTIVAIGQARGQEPYNKYPGGGSQVVTPNPTEIPGIRYGTPRRLP